MNSPRAGACAVLSVTTAASALLAGAASAQTLEVMLQGNPDWIAVYEEAAQGYEAANPGVDVQIVQAPHDGYNEKLGAAIMAGETPDVIQIDAPFLANYVWSGHLQPLEGLVDQALIDDLTPSGRSQGVYPIDDKLYAVGLADSSVLLYGNRRYLDEIGARIPTSVADAWTAEEFNDTLARLDALEEVQWPLDLFRGYGIKTEWVTYAYQPMLNSFGCDLISRETWRASGTLDSPECVEALTTMQGWVQNDWVVPGSAGTNQFYAEGQPAALAWGGNWVYAEALPALGDDLVVMPLPNFGEGAKSPNGTWIWGVSTAAEDPELAAGFIEFLIQDQDVRTFAEADGSFPGTTSFAAESPNYAEGGPMNIGFQQANEAAVPRPAHPAYPMITSTFMDAVDAILNGADVQETLTEAAGKIDEDIDYNAGYPPFGG